MSRNSLPPLAETSALLAIAEHRNFRLAARELGLSVPRVSELLKSLEERVNLRLVERTTRSVAPTLAGERLIERLRLVMTDYAGAFDALDDLRDAPSGNLRLTVAPPAAHFLIAPRLPVFLQRFPNVSVELFVDQNFANIVEGRYDAGIRPGDRVERDMIALKIGDPMAFAVAASPGYCAARGRPETHSDLARHDCIRFRFDNGSLVRWRFRADGRDIQPTVGGRLVVDDLFSGIAAALAGGGVVQLPRQYLEPSFTSGALIELLTDCEQPSIDAMHLYYSSRRVRPALRALIGFLGERNPLSKG